MADVARFDVIVVGGGPAGIAAAIRASRETSSVALLDEGIAPGGQIWRRDAFTGYSPAAQQWLTMLDSCPVTVIDNSTVIDGRSAKGRHRLLVDRKGITSTIESATLILATGARELFLPFPGWTLPGVLGVGGAQAMAKQGMRIDGKRIVVAGTGPLLIAVAASLAKRGAEIVAVVEQAPFSRMLEFGARLALRPFVALDALRYLQELPGGTLRYGSWVQAAHGAGHLTGVTIGDAHGSVRVDCDLLCTGYGLVPNTELARLLGCELSGDRIKVDAYQQSSIDGIFAAGECAGIGGVEVAVFEGMIAGRIAVGLPPAFDMLRRRDRARRWGETLDATFALRPEVLALATGETVICRCEDVRLREIDETWTARQAKLYARVGMGACQGRVCGAAMRRIRGWEADTIRAPLQPVALSSLASPSASALSGAT